MISGDVQAIDVSRRDPWIAAWIETNVRWNGWLELAQRVEQARAKGIQRALRELHSLKKEGDARAICWFLEKMDRSAYGNQSAVVGAQQNNFYAGSNGKESAVDEIAQFIAAQRQRMALARSLRLSDPEKAAAIEAETLDLDSEIDQEELGAPAEEIVSSGPMVAL
jgi:hypothetical protein